MIEVKNKSQENHLNKNEKIIILTLIICCLFAINYVFLHSSQEDKLIILESRIQELSSEITINSNLPEDLILKDNIEKFNIEKESISEKYFMNSDQDQLIFLLSYLIENPNITILQYIFQENIDIIGENEIKYMQVSIPYVGSYDGVIDSIKSIEYSPKTIVLDKLVINQKMDGNVEGQMDFKIYLVGELFESEEIFEFAQLNIDLTIEDDESITSPFKTPEVIIDNTLEEIPENIETNLSSFNSDNIYFIPSHEFISGHISKSNTKKFNKNSLRIEYNILAVGEKNYGFIDLYEEYINLKFPPEKLGIWIYAYDYSPLNVGVLLKGQMGEEYYIPFIEGIGWTGWQYIELTPPQEVNLYPLNLEKIYLQLSDGRSDHGIILVNSLSAIYKNTNENTNKTQYIFHIVKENESIEDISINYFGSIKFINDILKLNEINSVEEIKSGKILLIKR